MVYCCIDGCITAGEKRKFLSGNIILCKAHYIDLFEIIFTEECNDGQINHGSVSSALAQITVNMESKQIKSILPKLEKDDSDDEVLFIGTSLKT